jgi:chromosome segregation ATPase
MTSNEYAHTSTARALQDAALGLQTVREKLDLKTRECSFLEKQLEEARLIISTLASKCNNLTDTTERLTAELEGTRRELSKEREVRQALMRLRVEHIRESETGDIGSRPADEWAMGRDHASIIPIANVVGQLQSLRHELEHRDHSNGRQVQEIVPEGV